MTLCFAHRSMSAMAMSADAATLNGTPVTPHSEEDRGGESGACCARDAGAIGHGSGAAQRQTLVIAIRESHVSAARGEPEETVPAADPLAEAPSFLWQYRAELDRLRRPRVYPIWQSTEVVGSTSTSPTGPPLHHASPSASPPQPRRRLNASCCFPPAAAARTGGAARSTPVHPPTDSHQGAANKRTRARASGTAAGPSHRLAPPRTHAPRTCSVVKMEHSSPLRQANAWTPHASQSEGASSEGVQERPGGGTGGADPSPHQQQQQPATTTVLRSFTACQPSMDGGMRPSPMEAVSEHASLHRGRRL